MAIHLSPYISFKDNAREAMEFYKTVFGGTLTITTFKDMNMAETPEDADKVMNAMLRADNGTIFMGADTPSSMKYTDEARINLTLHGDNEAELRRYWDMLSEGGQITQPLVKAEWGDTFGMLIDRFGILWMVNIEKA